MIQIIVRRLLLLIPILIGISMLTFGLMRLVPGDAAVLAIGQEGIQDPVTLANTRREYGLDKPLVAQYGVWFSKVVRGDFGTSLRLKIPVLREIARRLPLTLELTFLATLFGLVLGGILGTLAAASGKAWSAFVHGFTIVGMAVPNFVLATLFILYGPRYIPYIPTLQYVSASEDLGKHLSSLIYPVIALGLSVAAMIAENTRSAVSDTMSREYVRVARAKGLAERQILVWHVLRNALIPIVTISGLQAATLLGGTIITESIFALPGLGRLAFSAINLRDYPMVQGIVIVVSILVVCVNLLADLVYGVIDPRIRVG